nr:PREDICTED: uncharacterized protein LOC105668053 [Linepithema humile]
MSLAPALLTFRVRLLGPAAAVPRSSGYSEHPASDEERRTCGYFKDQEFLAAEEAYHEAVDHLHEAFGKFSGPQVEYKNTSTDSSCRDATAAALMQLPRINLPKFNRKLTEWANFKVDEYDNSFAIVTAHIRAFADMPAMRSESAAELKNLRDTASASLAALACMGRPVDTWDDLLVYIISRKFSDSTRREWNLRRGDFKDCPTYRDLSDFMTNRVRGLTAPPKYTEGSTPSARNERLRGSVHTVNSGKCAKCVGTHALHKCPSFLSQPIDSRWQTVKRHKLCCNCLRNGHFSSKCPTTSRCFRCKRAHHSTLHRDTAPSSEPHGTTSASDVVKPANQDDSKNSEAATVQSVAPEPSGPGAVLLATAWVSVKTAEGRTFQTRALLDQGSTFSFISEAFCQLLRTRRYQVNLPIRCFGEKYSGSARSCVQLKLSSRFADKPAFSLLAYSYQRITAYAASRMRPLHEWSHLRDLQLADPDPSSRHPIHLLIGADLYGTLLRNDLRQGPTGSPTAQATALGWIISGPTGPTRSSVAAAAVNNVTSDAPIDVLLQRFWTDEDIPSSSSRLTADEEKCENFFLATHSRDDSGRYTVRLPFKTDTPPEIGASRAIAERMLVRLQSRLKRHPEIATEYAHFLTEYENLSHLEMVPLSEDPTRLPVYIPHHPVLRATNTTTKLRVVFNASCRTSNGTSLNDHLLIGQKLQQDLAAILLRWRMFKVVCSADIEKMFRQIRIHTLDADYQRILWQPPGAESPHSYRLLTVTYGTASAPYLAMRVLRQLMADEGSRFPKAAAVLDKYIYVDDVLIGADTVAELIETRDQLIAMMNCGGFPLRKWSANTPDALRDLPAEIINAKQLSFEETGIQKILGLTWQPRDDFFQFTVTDDRNESTTKRSVLSCVAKLYDPLGWVAPVVITAKVLMQELWLARLEWDDPLPTDIQTRWVDYREQLTQLFEIRIPRWVGRHHENLGVEIHGFADASTRAYAAAVYLRVIHSFSEIRTHLLVARTKVAPIKTISIPRLELNAIVLLSRLITWVSTALDYGYVPRYGWTDSTVALAWVSQHPSRWKTYVANRVSEIQSVNPTIKWNHVPSEQNPADCASRGISTSDLKTHPLWWNGPLWLRQPSPAWPDQTKREGATRTILTEAARASVQHVNGDPEWDLPDTYSTWTLLVRATANAKKFIAKLRARHTAHGNFESTLTCEELKNAELFWLTTVQTSQFALELESLQKTGSIHRSSRLKALQPFIGEDKLLRLGGRLERAFLSYAERHPIILADHRVVRLLISKAHKVTLHGGTQLTLRVLRQQYWIISARSLVKQHIRNCVICVRNRAKPLNQKMAALPARRVNPAPPFSSVGLDYAGPFLVTTHAARGQRTYKHFVAVFVCFVTKAVHLECVEDYSTSAFLAAFSRFTSRRGLPTHVHSDNGTNFQGADRELYRAWKSINNDEELRASVVNDKISWHFSPPAAPHFGGLWEAAVKGFKLHFLNVIAGARTLSRAEFVTLLCKIEACLNSRPLAAQSDDPSDLAAITPGHFLIG